jgi:hypothetical protein
MAIIFGWPKGKPSMDRSLRIRLSLSGTLVLLLTLISAGFGYSENPLSARVEVTNVQSYSGGKSLPKPSKILVYDFAISPSDVQVDKSQEVRLRHLVEGDKNPEKVGENAVNELSKELVKSLKKTGLPVEHVSDSVTPPADALVVKGAFLSVKEGDKAERVVMGLGEGSAEVQTKVEVLLGQSDQRLLISSFQTDTTLTKNVGAAVPVAAGVDPAAAAAKSKISDRKKTVGAYASKTADAAARQITSTMAELGWVKVDSKGKTSH